VKNAQNGKIDLHRCAQPWKAIEVHAESLREEQIPKTQEIEGEVIGKTLAAQDLTEAQNACLSNIQQALNLRSKALQVNYYRLKAVALRAGCKPAKVLLQS